MAAWLTPELANTVAGSIIGFLLAVTVDIGARVHSWWMRPRLQIETQPSDCQILKHATEAAPALMLSEIIFGFRVANTGRSIATGVRAQIIHIEACDRDGKRRTVSRQALDLKYYGSSHAVLTDRSATIIPNSEVIVELGRWREDYANILPSSGVALDYFEESVDSDDLIFTVAVFSEGGVFAARELAPKFG